jgi:large conductance mechanosensitive channel
MLKGFKNFLMQGNLVIIAVGLVIALAFSALVTAFTTSIITPLINALAGSSPSNQGLGWSINGQRIELGAFISAIIYFIIFMLVIYFVLVVPYRRYMSKRGISVFATQAAPPPTKTCPECLSADLPLAATKCLHCASVIS